MSNVRSHLSFSLSSLRWGWLFRVAARAKRGSWRAVPRGAQGVLSCCLVEARARCLWLALGHGRAGTLEQFGSIAGVCSVCRLAT